MIKKTTTILLPLLCFTAQYAAASKLTENRLEAPVSSSYTTLWFILAFGGVFLLVTLYNHWSKVKMLFRMFGGTLRMEEDTQLTEDQQRKMLLSGVYSTQKSSPMNVIKTGMGREERRELLSRAYGITDSATAKDKLDYFKDAGSRRFFTQVAESLKLKNKKEIQQYISESLEDEEDMQDCWEQVQYAFASLEPLMKEQIIRDEADFIRIGPDAWDAGRLVFVARMCAEEGWITEEELWHYADAADEIAHRTLTSWEDFGKSYIIGRCLWCGTANYFEVMAGYAKKMYTNPKSPWKRIPFAK